jgi:hypothetical protein
MMINRLKDNFVSLLSNWENNKNHWQFVKTELEGSQRNIIDSEILKKKWAT